MNQAGFDNYLQSYGFNSGAYFDGPTTRSLYRAYESGQSPAWSIVMSRRQQAQSEPSSGMGGMGGMGGMVGGMFGGGGGGSGSSSGIGGGSYGGLVQGAISGYLAGEQNAKNDPNMSNKRDGFGTKYPDYRAQVGGTVGGAALGYYGLGSIAGPAVTAAHTVMEPTTRWLINTGDSIGGAGGALMLDPLGTLSSGKYDGKELALGALMGPAAKWFKII